MSPDLPVSVIEWQCLVVKSTSKSKKLNHDDNNNEVFYEIKGTKLFLPPEFRTWFDINLWWAYGQSFLFCTNAYAAVIMPCIKEKCGLCETHIISYEK